MVRSKINPRYWSTRRRCGFCRLNTLRFQPVPGNTEYPRTQRCKSPAMTTWQEKLTSLQAAVRESLTPNLLEAAPEGANPTGAEKIAAAVDLAISLEDS